MFRRRKNLEAHKKLRDWLWPYMGWNRAFTYWVHRVNRLPGSTYSLSAGIAFGAAVSFTPFVGFHIILGGILAWLFRANIIASTVGTLVGNPWTFPFIWLWLYQLGVWMGVGGMPEDMADLEFAELFGNIFSTILELDMNYFIKIAWPVIGPMLVGAIPTAIVAWFTFYFLSVFVLESAHERRLAKRKKESALNEGP